MILSHNRVPRDRHPADTEPEPPRGKPEGWFREMLRLVRQYRQAGKDYKAAMEALERRMERIMQDLKLPREWEAIDGIKVVDPDGWSCGSYQSWGTPISREEWDRRVATSTIRIQRGT